MGNPSRFLPGTLANLYFNAVNTDSAFVTTYTPKDTRLTDNTQTILSNYSKLFKLIEPYALIRLDWPWSHSSSSWLLDDPRKTI